MSPTYTTYPGVYIEEVTGPGVIAGVGTSTAAFIGPAAQGPMVPTTITTFDDFKRDYGRESDGWPYLFVNNRWYYLGHAVQGFFENGGTRAVILRVGTAKPAHWSLKNGANQEVLQLEARTEGAAGNTLTVSVTATGLTGTNAPQIAFAIADVLNVNDTEAEIKYQGSGEAFVAGDRVRLFNAAEAKPRVILSLSTDTDGKDLCGSRPALGRAGPSSANSPGRHQPWPVSLSTR